MSSLVISLASLTVMFSFFALMGTIDNNLPIARVFLIVFIGSVVIGIVAKIQKMTKKGR